MSEIKPVYKVLTVPHGWKEVPEHGYQNAMDILDIEGRILYPAAAYEALQRENERLTKCLISANANHEQFERKYYLEINKVEDLQAENEAQAKRIAELEAGVVDIHDWTARWTRPDHPIVKVADRLLSASKNGE